MVYVLNSTCLQKMAVKRIPEKVSDDSVLDFTNKFKITAKNGEAMILGKKWQMTLRIPCGLKILPKSAPFPT